MTDEIEEPTYDKEGDEAPADAVPDVDVPPTPKNDVPPEGEDAAAVDHEPPTNPGG